MISIKYISSSKSPSGYGEAARMDVAALFSSGVNISTDNLMQMAESTNYGIAGAITDNLQGRNIPYKISIVHLTPDLIPQYKEKGIYTISRLFWETNTLPKEWIKPLNDIDEIWTASPQMAEMIHKSGVTTLCTIIPQPIDTTKSEEKIDPFMLTFPKDFIFYSIGQWIDRKNFRGLLRAYWKTFTGEQDVSLLIKSYRMNYTDGEFNLIKRDIEYWKRELKLKHYPKVLLTHNLLSESQIGKLHMLGDCFIQPSSGEGWSRPTQEAMLFGKPVISGDNGGITDIMTTSHYFVVPSEFKQATEVSQIPWYTRDMKWKALNEEELGKQMKYVFKNYDKAMLVGKKAQEYVVNNFSFRTVGDIMLKRLLEIQKSL